MKMKNSVQKIICFSLLFLCVFIFFMTVHPVIPWDGDDWATVSTFGKVYITFGLPGRDLSNNILANIIGTMGGYLSVFVIYPIIGDYICSFVIVNAFLLALSISLSLASIYSLLIELDGNYQISYIGVFFFFISAFVIFKTTSPSTYLYWQYNQCTTYYYSIPGYLSSAFAIYLLKCYVKEKRFDVNLNTGVCLAILYFLIFSFLPAALLITVVSFCVLVDYLIRTRNFKKMVCHCWFHMTSLFLFAIKLYLEFHRVFDHGYFSVPTQIKTRLKASFLFIISTFTRMNKLFLLVSVIIILLAVGIFIYDKRDKALAAEDYKWFKLSSLSLCFLLLLGIFFLLFGVIDMGHLVRNNGLPVRTDSMYVFYFMFIWIITLDLSFLIQRKKQLIVMIPLILVMMSAVVLSPKNKYSDSIYMDSTPDQKFRIMKAVVEEARIRDERGENSLVAHIPRYGHWGSDYIGNALYIHNITNSIFSIEFRYEDGLKTIYFE